ncbi:UDP-glucose 4-epimerase family protein [Zhongshania sp.]|uniref:UDP-glucose 4-epimerase family protein n=1 Tax=Zhongshania sp. TaxID=1971902 RepID=UPI00356404A4
MKKKILITGANGFVGSHLILRLSKFEYPVAGVVRAYRVNSPDCIVIGDIDEDTKWRPALDGCDVVIHAAARTHVMNEESGDVLGRFRKVNVQGTINLARQAAEVGVQRFIFISSIKVNGESTSVGDRFDEASTASPIDPYGISKYEAEQALFEISSETGMEIVVIRPPLIYGSGVKGNFAMLSRVVRRGLPLPLGAIQNSRTMVGIDNLVSLIIACIEHPSAANQIFLAGDCEDLSTTELLRRVAKSMGRPCRLFPVPKGFLVFAAKLLGKNAAAQRLFGSLQIDISKARMLLEWEPTVSVDEGLRRCFVGSSDS